MSSRVGCFSELSLETECVSFFQVFGNCCGDCPLPALHLKWNLGLVSTRSCS